MITFIAVPKPFNGDINIIQTNAIKSWTMLKPCPEIILMGKDKGVKEFAEKLNLRYIPEIETNEYNTPLYSSIFKEAEKAASHNLICHITSDVILISDFTDAYQLLQKKLSKFLAISRRTNLEIKELIDFSENDWQEKLKEKNRKAGKRKGYTGSDIFMFPKDVYKDIPDFTLGRAVFDNWLIYHSSKNKIPVVDMAEAVTVIHQDHDYLHSQNGQKGIYTGIEAKRNFSLAGGYPCLFTVRDSDYKITKQGIIKNKKSLSYSFYRWLVSYSRMYWFFGPIIKLTRLIFRKGFSLFKK